MEDAPFFRLPFALEGDQEAIPQALQPTGDVSFQTGYGFDYERDPEKDPTAKDIERTKMNWLFWAITSVLRQYQTYGAYPYIPPEQNDGKPYPYTIGARCVYGEDEEISVYESLVENNTALPTDETKWMRVRMADFVPKTRKVSTTAPIKGGGTLEKDVIISIDAATAATPTKDGAAGSAIYAKDSDTTSRDKAATPAGVAAQVALALVPAGGVIMFSGSFGGSDGKRPIPRGGTVADQGWALCDGTNGTPDLRDVFVVGAGGKYTAGSKGGAETHPHAVTGTIGTTTLTTQQLASHPHYSFQKIPSYSAQALSAYNSPCDASAAGGYSINSDGGTNPTAGLTSSAGGSQPHGHGLTASATAASNIPPYYAISYIMKL